jgi:hypothetical protein
MCFFQLAARKLAHTSFSPLSPHVVISLFFPGRAIGRWTNWYRPPPSPSSLPSSHIGSTSSFDDDHLFTWPDRLDVLPSCHSKGWQIVFCFNLTFSNRKWVKIRKNSETKKKLVRIRVGSQSEALKQSFPVICAVVDDLNLLTTAQITGNEFRESQFMMSSLTET